MQTEGKDYTSLLVKGKTIHILHLRRLTTRAKGRTEQGVTARVGLSPDKVAC